MKELTLEATIENITPATAFIDAELEAAGCPVKANRMIDIAVDEMMSNIARYAYAPQQGEVTVRLEIRNAPQAAVISFIDSGTPYDPLTHEDPDTHLPCRERKNGGLGIYMVKKCMDDVRYEYLDGKNVVTITKLF